MWKINQDSLNQYFPEIEIYSRKCQLENCNHVQEKGCAVKLAVREKNIRKDRYESYLALIKDFNATKKDKADTEKEKTNENDSGFDSIESELKARFKVYIRENQKSLNIEGIISKLSVEEKLECLELICKLLYIELLDISKNGTLFLSDKINELKHLKKLRIDENAIHTERDQEFINELKKKGIKVTIYSI